MRRRCVERVYVQVARPFRRIFNPSGVVVMCCVCGLLNTEKRWPDGYSLLRRTGDWWGRRQKKFLRNGKHHADVRCVPANVNRSSISFRTSLLRIQQRKSEVDGALKIAQQVDRHGTKMLITGSNNSTLSTASTVPLACYYHRRIRYDRRV